MEMERQSGVSVIDCLTYPCPHCRVELMVGAGDAWRGWRRCPGCDRPLLPPDPADRAPAPWEATSSRDYLIIGPELVDRPDFATPPPFGSNRRPRARYTGWFRMGLLAGLAFSLFATMFAAVENSNVGVAAGGLVSLVFVLFLVRPAPKR